MKKNRSSKVRNFQVEEYCFLHGLREVSWSKKKSRSTDRDFFN